MRRRYRALRRRLRRLERPELRDLRRWLEDAANLRHASILVAVPLLIGLVTWLSNAVGAVSFLLFPPLASGTYTLFADPEGEYASPVTFVGGMTVGALSGWAALEVSARYWYHVPTDQVTVHAGAAALGIFLTAVLTWVLDLETPTAFSAALLVLLVSGNGGVPGIELAGAGQFEYVLGIAVSSALVAGAFAVWREEVYEQRARYIYRTVQADDHVLVPMRGPTAPETAMLAARIAGAHDAAKVVLLDVVEDAAAARATRSVLDGPADETEPGADEGDAASRAATALEERADHVRTKVGVPCEVLVAASDGDEAATTLEAAREANCDLIVTPYEAAAGTLSPFVRGLFGGGLDVVAFRSVSGRTQWRRVMVPVAYTSGAAHSAAHAMVDYAQRLAAPTGTVSIATCIDEESERRLAESTLADLAETVRAAVETRVSRSDVTAFLRRNDAHYDLMFVGASTHRSTASRFLSRPTFERVGDLETDVAVVHVA
jgi:nucleotide-binding universal stress UspA family protein